MDQAPSTKHNHDSERAVEQAPSTVEGVKKTPDREGGQCQRHKVDKCEQWPHKIEAVCAAILVFITGYYACYAKRQRDAMIEANRQTKKIIEINSRPYIGIETPDDALRLQPITQAQIVFHNSGKLPAYADLFWSLAYSASRTYSPNKLPHNAREALISPSPVRYPIEAALSGDPPAQTPRAQNDAIQGMHTIGGFVYLWAEARYGDNPDAARVGRYDTAICNEYTIKPGQNPTVERIATCPWPNSNSAK